ncbi:hypothetical protein FNU76_16905 [Chitinimonas arctica]|uniref:KANL3/Tex30 alpha/beta hydrolase-like domain-containing protein n=1 Tax=Chitinimonas arctica TaxID=2594795 RepID=A0A516SIB5_9NEIS|nr:alpha/beta family hydrolase [Chitinimonas arctica]QDQ27890.1 hypothetical protein FNU76_16905 [Chitinimonas arctica]
MSGKLARLVGVLGLTVVTLNSAFAEEKPAGAAGTISLDTPRGAKLELIADLPEGKGPFPALILAPGTLYHMRQPLLARLAEDLRGRGVAVLRFDWAYFSRDKKSGLPGEGNADELEDMRTVLNFARQDKRLDGKRMMLGGKSLGSLVGWRVFRSAPELQAALLLTPVCSRENQQGVPVAEMDANYPGLAEEKRPLALVSGERDPLCHNPILYSALSRAVRPVRVSIIGGDHGFRLGDGKDAATLAQNERNLALAVHAASDFVLTVLKP